MARPTNCFESVLTTKEKAGLRGELFLHREIVGVDLSGADLRGARFERTVIVDCTLAAADLRGASFIHCELRNVDLTGAILLDSRFDGTTFDDGVIVAADDRAHIERAGGTLQHAHASRR